MYKSALDTLKKQYQTIEKDLDHAFIEQLNYEELRDLLFANIIQDSSLIYRFIVGQLYTVLYFAYKNNDLFEYDLQDLFGYRGYSCLLNECNEVDDKTFAFFKQLSENYDMDEIDDLYETQITIYGLISAYKVITFDQIQMLLPQYSKELITFLVDALQINNYIVYQEEANERYIVDHIDQDLYFNCVDVVKKQGMKPYDYDEMFLFVYGMKNYLYLNEEAEELYTLLSDLLVYDEGIEPYFVNFDIFTYLVYKAHFYPIYDDLFSEVFPFDEKESETIQLLRQKAIAFMNTLPCYVYGGLPNGEVKIDEHRQPYCISLKEAHELQHSIHFIASHLMKMGVAICEEDDGIDHYFFDTFAYLERYPEFIDDIMEYHCYASQSRIETLYDLSHCVVDYFTLIDFDDHYSYLLDKQGNLYRCLFTYEQQLNEWKDHKELPLLLVNYHDVICAYPLYNDTICLDQTIIDCLMKYRDKVRIDEAIEWL